MGELLFLTVLGSDEVTRSVLMTANCSPGRAEPYVTAVITPQQGQTIHQGANLMMRFDNGDMWFLEGSLDRLATVNAGDNKPCYGFHVPTGSAFFRLLTHNGSRYYPKIDVDPWGGGARLEINDVQRQKVRDFLATCDRFAQNTAAASSTGEQKPYTPQSGACRQMLNSANPWDTTRNSYLSQEIESQLCGPNEAPDLPARWYLYIMAGRVNWDPNGYNTGWLLQNAADLCRRTPVGLGTISCFKNQIRNGANWQAASNFCRQRQNRGKN